MPKSIQPIEDGKMVTFRVTQEERELLKRAAIQEERTLSAFLRFWSLGRARKSLGLSQSSNTAQQAA
ncbi:MAG: plasmid mobilization protein [Thermodesulfobacteriota bacterium]